jgi:hypothetical protein
VNEDSGDTEQRAQRVRVLDIAQDFRDPTARDEHQRPLPASIQHMLSSPDYCVVRRIAQREAGERDC